MKHHPPPGATAFARRLRSEPTEAEQKLWRLLRENFPEARFRRQVPIRHFIVDFASHSTRLAVEADGGQHDDVTDRARTKLIEAEGYRVIRFWNNDILSNPDGVASTIAEALNLAPSLYGEGLRRSVLSARAAPRRKNTPTQPSPIEGEGS